MIESNEEDNSNEIEQKPKTKIKRVFLDKLTKNLQDF